MRMTRALLLLLAPSIAAADPTSVRAANVGQPTAARRGHVTDDGMLRAVEIRAPTVETLPPSAGPPVEHGPTAQLPPAEPAGPVSGALEELIERQMRKNEPS